MKQWMLFHNPSGGALSNAAILALEDGSVFSGLAFGARTVRTGEVVFNTSLTGYQEVFTDPPTRARSSSSPIRRSATTAPAPATTKPLALTSRASSSANGPSAVELAFGGIRRRVPRAAVDSGDQRD
jgi:hypothetical protein